MILPFPAVPGTMTQANVLDTSGCRDFLQDIGKAFASVDAARSRVAWRTRSASAPRVQVFRAAGIYTVVLAQDAREIPAALTEVPKASRPQINEALFDAFARWYPDWTIALCCFNQRRARLAHPMLWWYRPMFPTELFLPALDCHTGDVPDFGATVDVDHVVALGASGMESGRQINYRNAIPASISPYIQETLIGRQYKGRMPNGDFVCAVEDVRRGNLRLHRRLPTQR